MTLATLVSLAFEIAWDPTLRGILVIVTALVLLPGTVYMLLATNVGVRLGFLITGAGFFAWMAIMGTAWWVYGIGYEGDPPTWEVREVNVSESPESLTDPATEAAQDLSAWEEVPEGNPSRGEAQAAADEALSGEDSAIKQFESTQDYVVIDVFETGGKEGSLIDDWVPLPHDPHYAIVQVQPVVPVEVEFGETPPPAEPDESREVYNVVLVRDQGNERFPPFLVMITSITLFAVFCNALHHREKRVMENRSQAATTS